MGLPKFRLVNHVRVYKSGLESRLRHSCWGRTVTSVLVMISAGLSSSTPGSRVVATGGVAARRLRDGEQPAEGLTAWQERQLGQAPVFLPLPRS